ARPMTPVELGAALVSWSGSMFEYLMPALIMDSPPASLLDQTARLVVRRQRAYGAAHGVPWGISESAYNVRDLELTYQYSNFGVPGLGLERGLSEDLVIAPYATGLAAMIDPGAAARNFVALAGARARGSLGCYAARDYPRARRLQRTLRGDADGRGVGLQPVRRTGRHPLARGRHARSLGHVRLPAGYPERSGLVGDLPADRGRGRLLRGHVLRGPSGVSPARRHDHDHARSRGLPRRRRRDSPGHAREPRGTDARDRADLLLRAR